MPGHLPLAGQLFHTATVRSEPIDPPAELLRKTRQGLLRLPPHAEVRIALPIDWASDPIQDHNWRFQFHTLVWLDNVRAAAVKVGDDEMLAWYRDTLRSWISSNQPEDSPSDYSWFDMAVGMRVIALAFAIDQFGPEAWLLEAMTRHGEYLAAPENYADEGNHGLHQDMGLVVAGQALNRPDWIALAKDRIGLMFEAAVDDEGVSREGAIDYQYRNYLWHMEAVERLAAAGVKGIEWMRDRVDLMTHFLAHATSPSGSYALIGDTVDHQAPRIEGTSADWVNDPSQRPSQTSRIYRAGYVFARRNWSTFGQDSSNAFLTQRFGPGRATAVHGHEDAGSITLDAFGGPVLIDAGLYAYEAGEPRLYCRGRSSHNVIDVAERDYYPTAEAELVSHSVTRTGVFTTVRVVGLKGVTWFRSLLWLRNDNVLIVDDRVRLDPADDVVQRWHFPSGSWADVDPKASNVRIRLPSGAFATVHQVGSVDSLGFACGATDPMQGWISRHFRELEPAPEVRFTQGGDSVRLTTILTYARDRGRLPVVVRGRRTTDKAITTIRGANGTLLTAGVGIDGFDLTRRPADPSPRPARPELDTLSGSSTKDSEPTQEGS